MAMSMGSNRYERVSIAQLQAFLALKQSGLKLNRDVLLIATADEEAGGFLSRMAG